MTASSSPDPMVAAADAFLKSLDGDGRKLALIPFTDSARVDWSYLPGRRAGLRLGQMSSSQKAAAMALLRSGLSELGYEKTTNIVALEEILGDIERGGHAGGCVGRVVAGGRVNADERRKEQASNARRIDIVGEDRVHGRHIVADVRLDDDATLSRPLCSCRYR